MGDVFDKLALGMGVALTPMNLLFVFVGALLGTLIGVLPGIGPVATLAMLIPITYYLEPTTAIIMLAGIYYGAQYGGSTTAILVNMPGESSSVVTCLDGYQMARQGRAGSALAIAAIGSLFAGVVATFLIAFAGPTLADVALSFGPAEYFSLMVFGLVAAIILAHGSVLRAFGMMVLGLALGIVGTDVNTGAQRLAFGIPSLVDGIDFVSFAIGLFAVPEILRNLENPEGRSVLAQKISRLWPTRQEFRQATPAIMRGTVVGSTLGVLPGGGALLSSFAAYMTEKRVAKDPSRFGKGAIEGVAGPESANNAGAQTSFIPLLTMGIPSNVVMALLAGALTIQGIQPGPEIITKQPELFWGLIASMLVGNVMLLVINLPMIGVWVKLLKIPYRLLYPSVLLFCCVGVYTVNNNTFDLVQLVAFSVLGMILWRLDCEPAPMVLAFLLGPLMEENLRRALLLSRGDPATFIERPISLGLLLCAAVLLIMVLMPFVRRKREVAFAE